VRAAEITGFSIPRAGLYTVKLAGETGKTITVHTSLDLTNWLNTATVGNANGTTTWTDTRATNMPMKFYRASSP
jgi:hypothetical protein